jgi:hypothetical protein
MNCRIHQEKAALPPSKLLAALAGLTVLLAAAMPAWATGGPENVLLVVNPQSQDSLCIANHYAALRHIPRNNILFIDWDPKQETTDVDTFREKILLPVLQLAVKRPIPGWQIDYVVYSSDFPWGVQIDKDLKFFREELEKNEAKKDEKPDIKNPQAKPEAKKPTWMTYCTPLASTNGLTFLWQPVVSKGFYVAPQANWYFRTGAAEQANEPTLGFSSATAYGPHGEAGTVPGRHYLLSMMLGVTSGRGNSREEVISYLKRSAAADGTHPRGTIYFMENGDIRSKVRQAGFFDAVKKLTALGVAAKIGAGAVPEGRNDVQGAMLGVADFSWKNSRSTILPGAICEHFTSFGGDMHRGASQTPLSELLRYGAAAASGAVTEPYSIPMKFPVPMMQVHYARGCTVAESFYQAVQSPYQLLIVGDPLCRPWAVIPEITCTGLAAGETVLGTIHVRPKARFAGGLEVEHFEMTLDGNKIRDCGPTGSMDLNTDMVADGYHEIGLVAETKGPLPARGEKFIPFFTSNRKRTITVTCVPEKTVSLGKTLLITVKSPHATSIQVLRGTRRLADPIPGDSGEFRVPASALGCGPVQLQIIAAGDTGGRSGIYATPLNIVVTE